jgi:hypothetical protein
MEPKEAFSKAPDSAYLGRYLNAYAGVLWLRATAYQKAQRDSPQGIGGKVRASTSRRERKSRSAIFGGSVATLRSE